MSDTDGIDDVDVELERFVAENNYLAARRLPDGRIGSVTRMSAANCPLPHWNREDLPVKHGGGRPRVAPVLRRLADHPPPTPLNTPCRLWQGSTTGSGGYGNLRRGWLVHRWVVAAVGRDQFGVPFTDGCVVMHLCDHRLCFRFDHLMIGSHQDNAADRDSKGRNGMPGRKLSDVDIDAIRRSDEDDAVLAKRYGVWRKTIWKVRTGRTWKSSPDGDPTKEWLDDE